MPACYAAREGAYKGPAVVLKYFKSSCTTSLGSRVCLSISWFVNYSPWSSYRALRSAVIIERDSSPAEVSVDMSHSLWSGILPGFVMMVRTMAMSRLAEVNAKSPAKKIAFLLSASCCYLSWVQVASKEILLKS